MTEPFLSAQWHRVSHLRLRLRHDVRAHRHLYRGEVWYVVEDELSGRQVRLSAPSYMLVGLLDGRRTVGEAWQEIVDRLGDDAPAQGSALRALAQLHSFDLLQGDLPPATGALLERSEQARRSRIIGRFANPLSLSVPLFDPERFLSLTAHLARPLFSAMGLLAWLMLMAPALVLAGIHWSALTADFTDRILARESLVAMALVYPVTKLVHELGHGYAIKRWGGSVHEAGVMVMVLVPMPYVDASAAAAFRSKWSRIVVAAAGMMAEAAVAALAVVVWVLSEPGMVRSCAYAVMVSAGIGTVVFNANPLMRLDGYYILADLIEIPNLSQRSSRLWRWISDRVLLGPRGCGDRRQIAIGSEVFWCTFYAPLALACRWGVSFGLGAFVAHHHFYAGAAIALWGAATTLVWPLSKGFWRILTAPAVDGLRLRATTGLVGLTSMAGALALLLPVPLHATAEGVVWMPEDGVVRAAESGIVTGLAARVGSRVVAGDPLFALDDVDLAGAVRMRRAEVATLDARLASELYGNRVEAAVTRQELAYKEADLATTLAHVARLTVGGRASGVFVVPRAEDLPGRFVRRGDVLGFVTPVGSRIVRAVVGQDDVDLVRNRLVGAMVLVPGRTATPLAARVVREVPGGSQRLPSAALGDAGGGGLAADPRDASRTQTLARTFVFDLELAEDAVPDFGQRVLVRFALGSEPVGFTLYRRLRQLVLARFDA